MKFIVDKIKQMIRKRTAVEKPREKVTKKPHEGSERMLVSIAEVARVTAPQVSQAIRSRERTWSPAQSFSRSRQHHQPLE